MCVGGVSASKHDDHGGPTDLLLGLMCRVRNLLYKSAIQKRLVDNAEQN